MMKRDQRKNAEAHRVAAAARDKAVAAGDKAVAAGAAAEDGAGAVQGPAGTACVRSAATGSRTFGDSPAMSRNALGVA
jgi:hypothetical protein